MKRLREVLFRLQPLFRKRKIEAGLSEEIQAHLEMAIEANLAAGMSPEDARYAALREFGGVEQIKERYRDERGIRWLDDLLRDIGFAFRQLRKTSGFTAVVVLSLALAIGASTAVFSVLKTLVLQPLPIADADRLVELLHLPRTRVADWETLNYDRAMVAPADYLDWKQQCTVFDEMAVVRRWFGGKNGMLRDANGRIRVKSSSATANFFKMVHAEPVLGRAFHHADDQADGDRVAVLSYRFWQQRFGEDPGILGRTVTLEERGTITGYTVVGVLPPDFPLFGHVEVWISNPLQNLSLTDRGLRAEKVAVIARLKPGISVDEARTQLAGIAARLDDTHLRGEKEKDWTVVVTPIADLMARPGRPYLLMMFAMAGCVMLIACANTANLLLMRTAARKRELAIRAVIGAGRGRIFRQLFTETVLLAALGAAGGLLMAVGIFRSLAAFAPGNLYGTFFRSTFPLDAIRLDATALVFVVLLSVLTVLLFGVIPALRGSRMGLNAGLKDGGGGSTYGPERQRLTKLLVIVQVGLALMLVAAAGLLTKSFILLANQPLGYDPTNLVVMDVELSPRERFATVAGNPSWGIFDPTPQYRAFLDGVAKRLKTLPGVVSVAVSPTQMTYMMSIYPEGRPPVRPRSDMSGTVFRPRVMPGYFKTLGIPILKGRDFDERDTAGSPPVAIITEEIARRYFPNEEPLGKRIVWVMGQTQTPYEIVGVVGDNVANWRALSVGFNERLRNASVYFPLTKPGLPLSEIMSVQFTIRASRELPPTDAVLRDVVRSIDADQEIISIKTMQAILSERQALPRFYLLVFGVFAAVSLVLSAIGVYGVIAYSVTRRTHEIGIRLALGASRSAVLDLVITQGMRLALLGIALGLAAGMATTRVLASLLYHVIPTDPLTFLAVTVALAFVALLACFVPARRATRVDPMTALRCE